MLVNENVFSNSEKPVNNIGEPKRPEKPMQRKIESDKACKTNIKLAVLMSLGAMH